MKIIIIGGGKSGIYLAEKLRHDHDITVIEQRPEVAEHLGARVPGVRVIRGDGCEPAVLERAGASQADLVAALTGDDEDNLVIAYLAKTLHDVEHVFARNNHPKNEWLFTEFWGVDVGVSGAAVILSRIGEEIAAETHD